MNSLNDMALTCSNFNHHTLATCRKQWGNEDKENIINKKQNQENHADFKVWQTDVL